MSPSVKRSQKKVEIHQTCIICTKALMVVALGRKVKSKPRNSSISQTTGPAGMRERKLDWVLVRYEWQSIIIRRVSGRRTGILKGRLRGITPWNKYTTITN